MMNHKLSGGLWRVWLRYWLKSPSSGTSHDQGFALPLAMGLGFVIVILGMSTMMIAQSDRTTAWQRKESGASLAVTEGGLARTLAQLTNPNNAVLLTRNYDSLNPQTGKTYFGPDGILNSGDEEVVAVDEWTGFTGSANPCVANTTGSPDMTYSGTLGPNGQYTLKAYRYNSAQKTGIFLVEGQQGNSRSYIAMTLAINTEMLNFPGILTQKQVSLQNGRPIIGSNGNVYYDPASSPNPALNGSAVPGDASRSQYLSAIEAAPSDNVSGTIIACKLSPTFSMTPPIGATSLGSITSNLNIAGAGGTITYYSASQISLSSTILNVDTTNGPVHLYVDQAVQLSGTAQIRNIRTDGTPPRVGDLRIFADWFGVYDTACIQTAFLFADPPFGLHLDSTGDGCPSDGNTNVEGVVWMTHVLGYPNGSSGIAVPEDVSSLSDLVTSLNLPTRNKFSFVKNWQRVRL